LNKSQKNVYWKKIPWLRLWAWRQRQWNYSTTVATPATPPKSTGACSELGIDIFDYGAPEAAEHMATTWERLEVPVGREYNEDIRNKLRTGREVMIPEPQLPAAVTLVHQAKVAASKVWIQRLLDAKRLTETAVTVDLAQEKDNLFKADLAVKLAEIQNEMDVLQDQFDNPQAQLRGG
jgi:hypothetical protein